MSWWWPLQNGRPRERGNLDTHTHNRHAHATDTHNRHTHTQQTHTHTRHTHRCTQHTHNRHTRACTHTHGQCCVRRQRRKLSTAKVAANHQKLQPWNTVSLSVPSRASPAQALIPGICDTGFPLVTAPAPAVVLARQPGRGAAALGWELRGRSYRWPVSPSLSVRSLPDAAAVSVSGRPPRTPVPSVVTRRLSAPSENRPTRMCPLSGPSLSGRFSLVEVIERQGVLRRTRSDW